jgi:hypothetical protein
MEKERIEKRDFGFERSWTRYKDSLYQWENTSEARQGMMYGEPAEMYLRNAEKMLHEQNDKRIAKIKVKFTFAARAKNSRALI